MPKIYGQRCPVAKTLEVVGDRWTLLVVRDLLGGARRFRDLQTGLPGLAPNILSERLNRLEREGHFSVNFMRRFARVQAWLLTGDVRRPTAG